MAARSRRPSSIELPVGAPPRAIVGTVRARGMPAGGSPRIEAVLARAAEVGLTDKKTGRISGRVSPELVAQAKARTGIQSDTDLLEFALANVAIEDDFGREFTKLRGTVDPDLDLEF